jgi:tetratricopeptide (TPR) repeat protein
MAKTKVNTKVNIPARSFPFFIIGLIFIGLSLFFAFSPAITRTWGLNYIACFDPWVIILYYSLLVCFWIPQTNRYLIGKISAISKKSVIAFLKKHRYAVFALISIIAGCCFYLLKIKYIFLGDTDLRAKQIEDGLIDKNEYLTMLFMKYVYTTLGITGVQTVRIIDYISGSMFIFISLCTANLIGNTFLKKSAAFVISTLSLAILLQFCGYTEIYSLAILFLQAYLFTCLLCLKGKISTLIPAIILLIGVALHLLLICMLPSLIFLFYRNVLWKYPLFRNKITLLALALISLPVIYYGYNKYALPMMLPMEAGKEGFLTIFSIAHYVEFFNSQLLAAGIGFLVWIAILIYSLVQKIKYDATLWFFLISSLSFMGLMFVFRMERGSGDWDIAACAPVVYNLGNAYFLLTAYNKKWYKNIKYAILLIAGFSILHTSMWILTNKTDASIKWVEKAFETDPAIYYKRSFNNESMIGAALAANGLRDKAHGWYKKALLKYPNDIRMEYNYAINLLNLEKEEEAYATFMGMIKKQPVYPMPYVHLISRYYQIKDYDTLYQILLLMEKGYNYNPEIFQSRISKEKLDAYFGLLADFKTQLGDTSANQPQQ